LKLRVVTFGALGELVDLAIGGPGASEAAAASLAAQWLDGEVVDAASRVSLEGVRAG
jgi:hypothetical protein